MKRELAFKVPSLNEIEREAIILNAVCHLIDDMLNYGMVVEEWSPDWSNIMFRTSVPRDKQGENPASIRMRTRGLGLAGRA